MTRHFLGAGLLWLVLTAAGVYLALTADFYPEAMSDKGEEIEHAFRLLLVLSVPVFTMVVSAVVYSVVVHRSRGAPEQDGPHITGRGLVPVTWFAVTSGLTALVIVYPGLTSLDRVIGVEHDPDLTVEVTGVQWTWLVGYPDEGVANVRELVLPVDREVTFNITSLDVLHSFWVPAFQMKIDAVPGITTRITLTPTEEGDFASDPLLRLQCAELCGLSHSRMKIPVRVVSEGEFESWLAEHRESPGATPDAGVEQLEIVAADLLFNVDRLTAPAGRAFDIRLDNQDEGVPHNLSVYTDATAKQAIFEGEIFAGADALTYQLPAMDPGSYFFRCDVHPTTMTGTLLIEEAAGA